MPRRTTLYTLLGVPHSTTSTSQRFDRAHKYVTSPLFRNPFVFGCLRLLTGLYTLVTSIYLLVRSCINGTGDAYFSYFTNLSYVGLTAYLFASGVQTVSYASKWKRNGAGAGFALQRWPRLLQALHILLYTTVVTYPFIVTIVYWVLLSSPETFRTTASSYSAISIHVLNLFLPICEIVFSNSPPLPWIALPFTILGLVGYLGVAYITRETQGFYAYSFLDPSEQGSLLAAYIIGIAAGQCVIFALVHFIIIVRERISLKYKRVLRIDYVLDDDDDDLHGDGQRIAQDGSTPGSSPEVREREAGGNASDEWENVEYGAPVAAGSPVRGPGERSGRSPKKSVTSRSRKDSKVDDDDTV